MHLFCTVEYSEITFLSFNRTALAIERTILSNIKVLDALFFPLYNFIPVITITIKKIYMCVQLLGGYDK